MTNHEKWKLFTSKLPSPNSYIDFSFYWLITACLQRRVWYYSGDMALYPNLYVVLVGPPAVGKGVALGFANMLLRFHRDPKKLPIKTNHGAEQPPLFTAGSDSTTFESLVEDMSKNMTWFVPATGDKYGHSSYAFVLEELDSLFRRNSENVIKFLKNAYDCKQFDYTTKHNGEFRLRKPCMSLFAATQESFLRDAYKDKLFGQGFMSRTIFVFENVPRSFDFHISEFTDDQLQAKSDLLIWIKGLASLYGEVSYDVDTYSYLENWYKSEVKPRILQCRNERLQEYFGRKKVAMQKLALGMHFAEHTSMTIPLSTFERAIALLNSIEPAMAKSINFAGRNEVHHYLVQVLTFITEAHSVTVSELLRKFGADVSMEELTDILKELVIAYGVKIKPGTNGEQVRYEI